uniref:Uncharacterized protein n=1 Tax=Quercus lobata TaxID=97700 RepID=A0A7N2RCX4_QUELO
MTLWCILDEPSLRPSMKKVVLMLEGTVVIADPLSRSVPSGVWMKVDVYSFGIMLLEILCRRKSVDYNLPEKEAILEEWAYHYFECGELGKLVKEGEVDKKQLERITKVTLWCILDEPALRPSMKKVVLMLEGTVDIPNPPSRSVPSGVWSKE